MADLFIMCGIPGSGKSTFIKNYFKEDTIVISRDQIRLSLLKEGEDYFAHEKEVCKIMWSSISNVLKEGKTVVVDQTSLTPRSRRYLIDHVEGYEKVNIFWVKTDLKTAIARNEKRKGTIAFVPPSQICRMFSQFIPPTLEEGFTKIYILENEQLSVKSK